MNEPIGIVGIGNTLYVGNFGFSSSSINKYDATTGALTGFDFITGVTTPTQFALSGTDLYVPNSSGGTVSEYDLTTGLPVGGFSLTASNVFGIALSGNTLFVANQSTGVIGEYNASTDAPDQRDIHLLLDVTHPIQPVNRLRK